MRCRAAIRVGLWLGLFGPGAAMFAQEGTWSVSASAGIALLEFTSVDEDGRRDIASYNALDVPIGQYPPLRCAPLVEASAMYRFERDMAVKLFGTYQQARTNVALHDSLHNLSLDRRLTAVLAGVDLVYFFPPIVGGAEVAAFTGIANLWASADQITNETLTVKVGPVTEERVVQDAYADYRKSKLIVRAGVYAVLPFSDRVSFTAHVQYQYAPMGTLTGTLREFSLVRPHETTIEFNYSALQILLGSQITL